MNKRRFVKIFESNLNRYTNGGLLIGDIVAFKPKAIHHPDFENSEELKMKIKALMDGGLNLRVVNIKGKYPAVMGGSNEDNIVRRNALVDVAQEIAPGRYHNTITVPIEVLDVIYGTRPDKDQSPEHFNDVSPEINLPSIRDNQKRAGRINIKPTAVDKPSEDNEFAVGTQTMKSDVDGKLSKGDRELPIKNTAIPSSPAEGHKDPAKYTAGYMPKQK